MNYTVKIDVTMGIEIEVEANSPEAAEQMAKEKHFTPSDLRGAWWVGNDIVEVEAENGE